MHLNLARFRAADSARSTYSHRAADVTDCSEKPVKTCQNNLWFCKHSQKGRNRTAKRFFFSLNYKSFLIQSGFEQLSSSNPLASDSHLEKGCVPTQIGVCGCRNIHQFCFFFGHNFGYRYARKSFKGSKDADFGLVSIKA